MTSVSNSEVDLLEGEAEMVPKLWVGKDGMGRGGRVVVAVDIDNNAPLGGESPSLSSSSSPMTEEGSY